ncbi:succinate dehydrogenase, cytochrome b556 subunit [Rhodobacterales bacterium 52_120_T64]|nr:succinate dehydrogenase, cytochrome b556 subunit [Rhodobacterales bacterium 52_120_T64]
MADVNRGNRPLSPHLSIYRNQLSMITSITHRITGVGLTFGAMLVVWWFLAASTNAEYFATADAFLTSWFGELILVASLWALCYHFLNGIRHLVWDTGRGLELESTKKSGLVVVIGSVVLTIVTLLVI